MPKSTKKLRPKYFLTTIRSGRPRWWTYRLKRKATSEAEASAFVEMSAEVLRALPANPKGNPLEVARFAGISAAKRTSELIPMCHLLPLSFVDVTTEVCENGVQVRSRAVTTAQTGVEMEAMVAAGVAALTVYDMCKALDKGIVIREVVLERKSGGKSGDYRRKRSPDRVKVNRFHAQQYQGPAC